MYLKTKVSNFVWIVLGLICVNAINARDIYALSPSYTNVNAAISTASPGDKIIIPSGIAQWGASSVQIPGGVTVIGAGKTNTIIIRSMNTSTPLIQFDGANGLLSGLHGIAFENSVDGEKLTAGVRFINSAINFQVSDCKFEGFTNYGLSINGAATLQKGVIYNNEFIDNYDPNTVDPTGNNPNAAWGYGVVIYGDKSWPPLELGTQNTVFVEDNFFSGNRHDIASNHGSRYVFRYNEVINTSPVKNFAMTDAHGRGASDIAGSRSYEIYHNDYISEGAGWSRAAIGIRGGDGVIFNNSVNDSIVRTVELWTEGFSCGTYPGVDQVRSLYMWDNAYNSIHWINTVEGFFNNCPASIQENRDYFLYKKPNYNPYPYPHPKRNIALHKPTASSSKDTNHPSSFVVDGNIAKSRWWGANPHTTRQQWWQVDLLDVYDISKLLIMPYYDGNRYYKYDIQTSLDGVNWTTVITKDTNAIALPDGDSYEGLNGIHTRFLRVNMNFNSANPAVHLIEFRAFGKPSYQPSASNNIALYKPASTSKLSNGMPPSAVVDNTYELNNWWGTFPFGQWWQVDLEDDYAINEIVATNYYGGNRHYKYTIQASTNGVDWETVAYKNDPGLATKAGNTFYFDQVNARYLRVNLTYNSANGAVHLIEFRAYGSPSGNAAKSSTPTLIYDNNDVRAYPNPLTPDANHISLDMGSAKKDDSVHITITNLLGQTSFEELFHIKNGTLDIPSEIFDQGFNLIQIKQDHTITTKKIFKE